MGLAIILGSDHLERVEFASMAAFLASSMGEDVKIFATMEGVKAFRKEPVLKKETESAAMIAKAEAGGRFPEYFRKAKATGKVKITACSMSSKLFSLSREDYIEEVDGIGGLTSFLDASDGSTMISIW